MNRKNLGQPNGKRCLPCLVPIGPSPSYSMEHIFETPPNSVSPQAASGGSNFIFPPVTQDALQMISSATLSALHKQNCAILSALRIGGQQDSAGSYLETLAYQQQWLEHSYFVQLRQQQQLQLQQQVQLQQLAANALAHQHNVLAAPGSVKKANEISASLKTFAMKATEAVPPAPKTPIEQIMKDFDCNGRTCDYDGCATQKGTAWNVSNDFSNNIWNATNAAFPQQKLQPGPLFNRHLTDICQNIWKTVPMPTQPQVAPITANPTTASLEKNFSQKQSKRTNNAKSDKYLSVKHCVFCENNNEPEAVVKSHAVRDKMGRVLCPKLRTYICPICKASGDKAHTVKYCPKKPIITMEQAIQMESFRLSKIPMKNHIKSNGEVFERF